MSIAGQKRSLPIDDTVCYAFEFVDHFNLKMVMSYSQMQTIFDRTEIFEYLIFGHPQFKKAELTIVDGVLHWSVAEYEVRIGCLKKWFMAVLDLMPITEDILNVGFVFGGSNYLDAKFLKEKETLKLKKLNPVTPALDVNNEFFWKSAFVSSSIQETTNALIDQHQNDGYVLVSVKQINSGMSYPLSFTFRKPTQLNESI